ncbi:MAG TPA: hypothetical protein VMT57_06475 [Candidatus Thermoplasmatota archaeon]|nr:hypothetical protein [Candidatus Thermoplasmatota archaeon]
MAEKNISIKFIIDELLETNIFKEIAKRNGVEFSQQLAYWIVRYLLVIASMDESLKIGLDKALFELHGKKYRKILEITQKIFENSLEKRSDTQDNYIQ